MTVLIPALPLRIVILIILTLLLLLKPLDSAVSPVFEAELCPEIN